MDAGPGHIAELGGAVRCPWRGAVGAGVVEVCPSESWTLDTPGMVAALEMVTLATVSRAALQAFRLLDEARRRNAGAGGAAAPEAGRPAVPGAELEARADRLRQHRLAIVDAHLTLRCPRCHSAFVDYDGCAVLQCGVAGCGQHFCALCFFHGSSREVHVHLGAPARLGAIGVPSHPGVGDGYNVSLARFNAYHAERQARVVRQAVHAVVAAGEDAAFGDELWNLLQEDVRASAELPLPQPGANAVPAARIIGRNMTAAALVAAMRAHPGDAEVVQRGCWALGVIAEDNAVGQAPVVAADGPAVIVSAMRAHGGDAEVAQRGCWAIRAIAADNAAGQAAVVAADGPAVIVSAMRAHPGVAGVAHNGCWALGVIADDNAAGQAAVVAADGPAVIVSAMRAHDGVAGVAHNGCWALGVIAKDRAVGQAAVLAADGPAVIVSAMRAHGGDAEVAQRGCWAIRAIAADNAAGQAAVVAADGPAVIVSAMRAHDGVAGVAHNGCCALGVIAKDRAVGQAAVLAADGPAVIVSAKRAHGGDAEVARWSGWALGVIAADNAAGQAAVIAADGPAVIVSAIRAHPARVKLPYPTFAGKRDH